MEKEDMQVVSVDSAVSRTEVGIVIDKKQPGERREEDTEVEGPQGEGRAG